MKELFNELMHAITDNKDFDSIKHIIDEARDNKFENFLEQKTDDNYGDTPLIAAVQMKNYEVIKLLLQRGVDIDSANKAGNTAYDLALKTGEFSILRIICDAKFQDLNSNIQGLKNRIVELETAANVQHQSPPLNRYRNLPY